MKSLAKVLIPLAASLALSLSALAGAESPSVKKIDMTTKALLTQKGQISLGTTNPKIEVRNPSKLQLPTNQDDKKSQLMGGMNSGGGNSINHQLIESYSKDISEVPAYRSVVVPMLKEIESVFPTLSIDLENKMTRLTWYFIPKEIASLPYQQTGLPFASHQLAIQENGEVFIDDNELQKMTNEKIAELIIHETVLGLHFDLIKKYGSTKPVNPQDVRRATKTLMSRLLLKKPIDAREDFRFGTYPTADEFANGKVTALKALQNMSVFCEAIEANPHQNSMHPANKKASIEIGVIDFNSWSEIRKNTYVSCGNDPFAICDNRKWAAYAAYDYYIKPISTSRPNYGGGAAGPESDGRNYNTYFFEADILCGQVRSALKNNF